jgi:predicted nucleic acid-binding protein
MREKKQVVINTGPLIALSAATGTLDLLREFYSQVVVPLEVCREITVNGSLPGAQQFTDASWLYKCSQPTIVSTLLSKVLDSGEASVIQTALDKEIETVIIDEAAGRRVANLHGLKLTGSLGILLRAKHEGYISSLTTVLKTLEHKGIWLGEDIKHHVLLLAKEI